VIAELADKVSVEKKSSYDRRSAVNILTLLAAA
jgi:hypothetical protein